MSGGREVAREEAKTRPSKLQLDDRSYPTDPAAKRIIAGLGELLEQRPSAARDHAIVAVLDAWTSADFEASAADVTALLKKWNGPFNSRSCELMDAWMDRWLQIDSRGALRFVRDSSFLAGLPLLELAGWPTSEKAQSGLGGVLQALSRREPEWTRKMISDMASADQRAIGAHVLLNELAERNPALAEQVLASFAESPERPTALSGYVRGLVSRDVSAAFDLALAEPPSFLREELLRTVFWRAGKNGISETRDLLNRIKEPDVRRRFAAEALSAIGFEQREDALPFIKEESERMAARGDWAVDQSHWASSVEVVSRGPKASILAEWALGFTADSKRAMFSRIVNTWSGRDPAGFCTWLKEHTASLDAAAVDQLGSSLENVVRANLGAARTWSETLPAGPIRDLARFQVALQAGAEMDVAQAAIAYQSVAPVDRTGALARRFVASLLEKSGEAAAEWATQLPAGPPRSAALETLAGKWGSADPRAAAEWLQRLPAGHDRDSVIKTYTSQVAIADPQTAALWAEQVADPKLRAEVATEVYNTWSVADPISARIWIRNLAGIDNDAVKRLLRY